MTSSSLIIAEKNPATRRQLARGLAASADPVTTTGSAAQLLEHLLHNDCQVVVLGGHVEENLSLTAQIRLVKRCNPHLAIILVADEVSLGQERTVRDAGIYYRTNHPESADDWAELQTAVACAHRRNVQTADWQYDRQPDINTHPIQEGSIS